MAGRFDGKVALVTGSTQGLGAAIAEQLAGEGLDGVIVCGRNTERGEAVAARLAKLGTAVHFVPVELGDPASVRALLDRLDASFGRVDVLVNAAGLSTRGTIESTTPEIFDRLMAVNVRAPFLVIQGCVAIMRREGIEGSIVNIGSVAAYGSFHFLTPYATSKGALMTLTKNVAHSLLGDRIRCNVLNIGWMDTPGEDATQRRYHTDGADWLEDAEAGQPFGRLLKPAEVAKAVAFLASEDSGMMTGAVIDFDQSVIGGGSAIEMRYDPDQPPDRSS